jgi:seryl-tRNA synthetase
MLDIKFIRDNAEKVKKAITDKGVNLDLDQLLELDARRRALLAETETLRATKNAVSKEMPQLKEAERKVKILEMQEVDSKQAELETHLKQVDSEYDALMLVVPNIPSPESPVGTDETANLPWAYWSPTVGNVDPKDTEKVAQVPTQFDFAIKDHIALGKELDLIDTERGVETSGFRGYYLKNEAVLMHYGLMWLALNRLGAAGFKLFAPPVLLREFALVGSGHFPTGREEIYQVGNAAAMKDGAGKEETFLAGTSEPSLLAYYANQILDEKELPIKMSGISSSFRSEVGSYGKDAKGIYRVHEFMKAEQVVICKADINEADQWLENLRQISEQILQELQLPYRVLNIATGDMGAGKYKMYDLETWMPSRQSYGETHSDSNLTDWQARRLNIRYKDSAGKIHFAYTLNNTAIASPRILIAILENYQQKDGSVKVPEALRPYVGKDIIKKQ